MQAKESADDLVAAKKEIDAQVEAKKKEAKEYEIRMRNKAGTVGNIVGKNAPVSLTEDDNAVLRTWDPQGLAEPEERTGILPHHEVLLRLDAMDLERGIDRRHDIYNISYKRTYRCKGGRAPRLLSHERRSGSQPGAHFLRTRFFAQKGVQEDPAAVYDEQGPDG